ncbi:MAG TPA: hypothetical protein VD931_14245 [Baekduia sp.]|nr:hypothetical protein [Baekduia sp.]
MEERPEPVPLHDAEIAAGIARAAGSGRPADRRPTPEQLLAAFGETERSEAALRRVAAALALAGVRVEPPLPDAPPGERVLLHPPAGAGGRAASARRGLLGLGAVVGVLAAGALGATLVGGDDGDRSVDEALPVGTGTTAAPATQATTTATAATTPPAPPTAARTQTTSRTTTTRRSTRREKRPTRRRRTTVKVRVDASRAPTFLCVEDQAGRQLFNGTLAGRRIFQAREVRLNIGLSSTLVAYRTRTVRLTESPTGLAITRKGHRFLPLGQRPCG